MNENNPISAVPEFRYAGFWVRVLASLVDLLLVGGPTFLIFYLALPSRELTIVLGFFTTYAYTVYEIVGHAKWGQTIGKYVFGIKVVSLSGTSIGWKESILRSSITLVLCTMNLVTSTISLVRMPEAEYGLAVNQGLMEFTRVLTQYRPELFGKVEDVLSQAWGFVDVLCVLTNGKKRSLHDFIAGTMVIHLEPKKSDPV